MSGAAPEPADPEEADSTTDPPTPLHNQRSNPSLRTPPAANNRAPTPATLRSNTKLDNP